MRIFFWFCLYGSVLNGSLLSANLMLSNQCLGEELPAIFNGKDISGWQVPADNVWWHVENGVLTGKNESQDIGSMLWTKKQYQNFVMEFQFKFGKGTVDSGVFLRHENEQIQIGISGSLKRDMTGSPYISSQRGYPVEAEGVAPLLKLDDWNTMTIVAIGNDYSVWLNGRHVLNYPSETGIDEGPVGFQVHQGREMSIDFRDIRLAELG